MPVAPRSYVAGNFQLVLDGVKTGFLKSLDGGAAVAEVVSEPVGSSHLSKKHLGQISYKPFVVQFGMSMTNDAGAPSPEPKADHALPSHLPTKVAATPPALVKNPPA